MNPTFFPTPAEFRAWLEQHHETHTELVVGYYKVGSGKPSITWPESVDEALCFGWIDGVRHGIDAHSYKIRFTPRKPSSIWSAINIEKMQNLIAEGKVFPMGMKAWGYRKSEKSQIYSYENKPEDFPAEYRVRFEAHPQALAFFHSQAAYYQKTARYWVMSAKQEATRLKRLETLIEDSAQGQRVRHLRPPEKKA